MSLKLHKQFYLKRRFSARSLFCQFGVFKRRKLPIHLFCVLFHRVWSHVDLLLSNEFFISLYILIQNSCLYFSYGHNKVQIFFMEAYLFSCTCIFTAWYRIGWANKDWGFLSSVLETIKVRWYTYKVYRSLLKKASDCYLPSMI